MIVKNVNLFYSRWAAIFLGQIEYENVDGAVITWHTKLRCLFVKVDAVWYLKIEKFISKQKNGMKWRVNASWKCCKLKKSCSYQNMFAWLAPLLSSCSRIPFSVSNTRISVPYCNYKKYIIYKFIRKLYFTFKSIKLITQIHNLLLLL